ncbi:MAG: hypothetical protein JSS42_11600 [Proteobacteria bacterium]|uniref:hypothetical protein n=1 Tax=Rudaea sp. TaxID=2136325 RepID=UPI00321FE244|nr:hypothetical protein [Pseudomonadota bacterium]
MRNSSVGPAAALLPLSALLLALSACSAFRRPTPKPPAPIVEESIPTQLPEPAEPNPLPPAKPRKPVAKPAPAPVASAPQVPVVPAQEADKVRSETKLALAQDKRNAMVSADVGYYLDVLYGRLKQGADPGIQVARTNEGVRIDFNESLSLTQEEAQSAVDDCHRLMPLTRVLREYEQTLIALHATARRLDSASRPTVERRIRGYTSCLISAGISNKRVLILVAEDAAVDSGTLHVQMRIEPVVRGNN